MPTKRDTAIQGAGSVYTAAAFWAIDETNGSDTNRGYGATQADADASPLKTLGELNRRLLGSALTSQVTIHILSDVTAGNFSMLPNLAATNVAGYPILRGTKKAINSTPIAVTNYATHVPAANTGYLVTAAGIGSWAPYIGKMIENADGTKVGFVQSAVGTTARVTGAVNCSTAGTVTANPWAIGDQLTAYSLSRIPALPLDGSLMFWAAEYLQYGFGSHDGSFAFSNFGESAPFISRCVSEGAYSNGGAGAWYAAVQFYSDGTVGSEGNLRHMHGLFSACAVRGLLEFGSDSLIMPQNISGIPAFDIEAGNISLEGATILGASGASFSVFNCTSSAVKDTSGSNAADAASHFLLQGASNIYGSGNSSFVLNLPVGHHSVHKAGMFATTAAANPVALGGIGYAYAAIPVADTTNGAWLLDK